MLNMKAGSFLGAMALFAAALPAASHAEPSAGWYIGAGAGYNSLGTEGVNYITTPFGKEGGTNVKYDGGTAALVSVGWRFANGFRVELEGSQRRNSVSEATVAALRNAPGFGNQKSTSVFLNALYDFDKTSFGVTPYAGLGIGQTRIDLNNGGAANSNLTARLKDSQSKFAYQLIAGASFLENLVPGMSFTAEYRYMGVSGSRVHAGTVTTATGASFPITMELEGNRSRSFMLGIRYQFDGGK